MREIKFRCWDKEYKVMNVQGEPDLKTLQSFIFHYGDQELMQFTGLYDKNGKEVYEGDIVLYNINDVEHIRGKILFKNLAYQIEYEDEDGFIVYQRIDDWSSKNIKVLGNIYKS